jgi:hypothetical protein
MNSLSGAFHGSWPWLSILPSFFGIHTQFARHLDVRVRQMMAFTRVYPCLHLLVRFWLFRTHVSQNSYAPALVIRTS